MNAESGDDCFANDEDLLRRFRVGEREALSRVYWHYVGLVETVLRRCLSLTTCRWELPAYADLGDVVQEVFVKAFTERARYSYDSRREYRPFLTTIARNVLVDHLRSARRTIQLDLIASETIVAAEPREGEEVLSRADPQTMALVDRYVTDLAANERAVYLELYVHGRSQAQAAAVLGLSRQQVRTLESRLRGGLTRALARDRLVAWQRPTKPALKGEPTGSTSVAKRDDLKARPSPSYGQSAQVGSVNYGAAAL